MHHIYSVLVQQMLLKTMLGLSAADAAQDHAWSEYIVHVPCHGFVHHDISHDISHDSLEICSF